VPLQDIEDAGLEGGESRYPWAKLTAIEGVPVAIIQAYGFLGQDKFQVCFLCQLLEDVFDAEGNALAEQFLVSFDAEGQDNPRRRYLVEFADPHADPKGPVAMTRVETNNQSGFVWAWRKCPMPTSALEHVDTIQRSLYRQNWKRQALAAHRAREAAAAALRASQQQGLQVGKPDDVEDLPF
jgi:hypothetical protein